MNVLPRFAAVALAAFLFVLTPNIVLSAPAEQLALRWSELQPMLKGRQISVHLMDGATVEGKFSSLQADVLSIQVTKTSDPTKHPKGATRLARPELAQLTVKRRGGWKGRTIGLIAGGAIAALAAGLLHAQSENEGGSNSTVAVAAAGGGAAIGIGYLVGWIIDSAGSRPDQVVQILSDSANP